jgi:anti-sigma factor RsiW
VSELQWLEMELARQLRPVEAPEALWDRIHEPGTRPLANRGAGPRPAGSSFRFWPIAAALLLMGSGLVAWRISLPRDPGAAMEKLAEQELSDPPRYDLYSSDPHEIRTWVKTMANIDLELPGSGAVRLLGARLIRLNGEPVAAVGYKVGDSAATLLVCRKRGAPTTKHVFSRVNAGLFSWIMRAQVYAIASNAKDPQAACQLCHADPAPGGILKVTRRL